MEISKSGYDSLIKFIGSIKEEANENPDKKSDGYLLQCGKQQSYSHVWFELKDITSKMNETPKGYINWKIMNLLIGFSIGGLSILLLLNQNT